MITCRRARTDQKKMGTNAINVVGLAPSASTSATVAILGWLRKETIHTARPAMVMMSTQLKMTMPMVSGNAITTQAVRSSVPARRARISTAADVISAATTCRIRMSPSRRNGASSTGRMGP